MKRSAQYIAAIIFVSIVIKGFFKELNMVDSVILSAAAGIFAMYEFITETSIRKEFEEYKKTVNADMVIMETKFQMTKDTVSKISTAQGMRR